MNARPQLYSRINPEVTQRELAARLGISGAYLALRGKPALMLLLTAILTGECCAPRGELSETGLIELIGLGLFYTLLVRHWRLASRERRILALQIAMAALAWIFPLNTHPSFYAARWSMLVIAMLCASLLPTRMKVNSSPETGRMASS